MMVETPNYMKDILMWGSSHVQQRFNEPEMILMCVPRANIELYKESFVITSLVCRTLYRHVLL